jgi:type III secretion protein L
VSSIIKAGAAQTKVRATRELPSLTGNGRIVKRQMLDANEEARRLVEKASGMAAAIVEEARQAGYQEGLSRWNNIIAEAMQAKEVYLAASESELLRLAVKIAGKIIGEQLRLQPETIGSIVREALKSAPRERRLVIQVNPSDADAVNRQVRRLMESATFQAPEIEVAALDCITAGGCVIVSELGRVDAQIETQLQCMERVLLQARR